MRPTNGGPTGPESEAGSGEVPETPDKELLEPGNDPSEAELVWDKLNETLLSLACLLILSLFFQLSLLFQFFSNERKIDG